MEKKNINDIKDELFVLVGNEYDIISTEYINKKSFLEFKHNICGKIFKMRYVNFFGKKEHHHSNRCPYCSHGHIRKTLDEFKNDVFNKVGNEYSVVGTEYKSNKIPILLKHEKCGAEFLVRPDNFLNGTRCPFCASNSKGEDKIRKYLTEHNIEFKSEIWFANCRDKYPLPFDFAIYKNNKFCCLIEYYGIQHYQPIGKSPFATDSLKKHDIIKQNFCKDKNIPLNIISYINYKNLDDVIEKLVSSTIPWEGEFPQ